MEFEDALKIVSLSFNRKIARPLTEIEVALLFGAWNKLTYEEIAARSGYSTNYLHRDIGPKFWKLLSDVLGRKVNKTNLRGILTHLDTPLPNPPPQVQCSTYWGEAIDVSTFKGRVEEVETLTQWIIQDRCRMITLVGMGGMGKSTLATKVARLVQEQFQCVIWRSLRNAPPLEILLSELIPLLSHQQDIQPTLERLLYWLQTHRCLVILDNQDTLLQAKDFAGYYQPHFTNYGDLFQLLGESTHQSCILLTSREKSAEIAILEDVKGAVRSLSIKGSWETSLALIDSKQLIGTDGEKHRLCELYRCNPLALKIVATSIQSLFNGEISFFLEENSVIFNGIRRLLDQQFERLSSTEQTIMYWLAINREWTTINELQSDIVPAISRLTLLESLKSLTWRSLIESRSGEYTQQPVVMEYVTDCLVQQLATELLTVQLSFFNRYALIKTTVLDYIRESQIRLILQPLIEQLQASFHHNSEKLEQHLQSILSALHCAPAPFCGYGIGNFINLCLHLQIDLTGSDFSDLTIRHADLQGATLQQVNFQSAHFAQSVFTQTFGSILSIRFSPDGQQFAITDTNGGLQVWQFKEMLPLISIQAHQGWIYAAAWSLDGTTIATGCADQMIKLWDVRTGQCLRVFEGYTSWVCTLAWSPDGQRLACGGQGQSIVVWDGSTGACLTHLKAEQQNSWIWSLVWLADGTLLAGAYTDGSIKLWDWQTGECIQVIQAHENWVLSLSLHPNGRILASSGLDQTLKLWDWQTGVCLQGIATDNDIWRTEWSPDGERLAGATHDNTVRLWDGSLQGLKVLQGHKNWVWAVAWSPDGNTLASTSHDQTVKLWNPQTGHCIKTLQGYSNSSWCLRWSQDGIHLLSSSTDHTVQLWNTQTGQCLKLFRGHDEEVWSVAWSPDGHFIASSSADATIRIWDIQTGECLKVLLGHHALVRSVDWSWDGNHLISGGHDQTIKLWDVHSGQCLLTLSEHRHYISSLFWFPGEYRVASGSLDGTIRLWDLSCGVCDQIIPVNHPVYAIALSPDGKTLASGDYERAIKLWDLKSGDCLMTLPGDAGHIYSIAWSADGKTLASASADLTVRIWNVSTGKCQQVIPGKNWGLSVDWNPGNSLLAISYLEQPIQLWDLQTRETVQLLKRDRPYEGMNITGVKGIYEGQKAILEALGAIKA